MKQKVTMAFSVVVLTTLLAFCHTDPLRVKGKFFGIDHDNIGVVNGKRISMYGYDPADGWKHNPANTYIIGNDVKDVTAFGGHIAVLRNNGIVTLYNSSGGGRWESVFNQESNDEMFTFSKDYSRIFPNHRLFGMIKGRSIDFFDVGQPRPEWRFNFPDKCTDVIAGGYFIICLMPNGLDFYTPGENQWQLSPNSHFNYPNGNKNILEIPDDNAFGVVKGNSVDYYKIEINKPCRYDFTFTSPR